MQKKINLFLVGAAKSGTTSVWKALQQHSEIFCVENDLYKEPSYFSEYGKRIGTKRYHSLYLGSLDNHKYLLDASTAYLTSPESAQRIYQYNPNARIIIILRDPSLRAYSLYNWMTSNGYEWISTFERSLEAEESRFYNPKKNWGMPAYFWNYMYFRSGLYDNQIDRYSRLFNKVLILPFNEIKHNPNTFLEKIFDFLEVNGKHISLEKENKARAVYSSKLCFAARKATNFLPQRLVGRESIKSRDFLLGFCRKNHPPPQMPSELYSALNSKYANMLERLYSRYSLDILER